MSAAIAALPAASAESTPGNALPAVPGIVRTEKADRQRAARFRSERSAGCGVRQIRFRLWLSSRLRRRDLICFLMKRIGRGHAPAAELRVNGPPHVGAAFRRPGKADAQFACALGDG